MKDCLKLCVAAAFLLAAATCFASFHLFRIEQIYSNADGTVQFVVMHESGGQNGENFWAGQALISTHAGAPAKVYVFPKNLPGGSDEECGYGCTPSLSPTANKRVLIATQGFEALGLVTPDYVIPNGFLPTDGGTVNYAGVDQVTYGSLPTDGVNAINRNGATMQNRATNFAGASASVAPSQAPAVLNFQGMWWAAPAGNESGWGINFAHQGDVIFATWFTHDLSRKAWNVSMVLFQTGPNAFAGTVHLTSGPPLGTVPFDPALVHEMAVGTATLTFTDGNNGTFESTVNGVPLTKKITRQAFGVLPTCVWNGPGDLTLASNYTDMWWVLGGAESGWGINFTQQATAQGDIIFATWFTYDLAGKALPMSATLFKAGTNAYSGTLIRTSGPPFNAVPFNPDEVIRTEVGTATVTFTNGNRATFAYTVTLDGAASPVTQSKQLERQVFRAPGTACK